MAKIIKVGSQNPTFTSQKTKKSTVQTFRNSNQATNPFKFTNFEGNTLQFADVFEGFTPKSASKLRLIASSAAGSMNKMKSGFESIKNFVNRVRGGLTQAWGGITNAWDYACHTNISDVPVVKAMIEAPKNIDISRVKAYMPAFKGVSGSMEHINKGLATGIEILNTDITDIAKGLSTKWTDMVSKLHTRRISADMPVADLEALWRNEIELGGAV